MAQIERQIRWEAAAVEAGIRRYREELTDPAKTIADTSPGQRIIRAIMVKFVPKLREAQEAIEWDIKNSPGRQRDWTFLFLLLPPEELAFLTLRAVMSDRPCDSNMFKRTLTSCVRTLVASIEQEVAFRSWVDEERSNRREAKQLGKPYRDLYEALRRSTKTINGRTFRRWMNRIERLWRRGRSEEDRTQLGCALITYLVDKDDDKKKDDKRYFELITSRHSGRRRADAGGSRNHRRPALPCGGHEPRTPTDALPTETSAMGACMYDGGYYLLPEQLIRAGLNKHTSALTRPIGEETVLATNTVQNTARHCHHPRAGRVASRPADSAASVWPRGSAVPRDCAR